jgi:fructose-bisphosphate aldolase class I
MANDKMLAQMTDKPGFIAALDQSGGSTPGALRQYGVPDSAYSGDAEMFKLMHEMRTRIITAPAFTGDKIIGAILFEMTMDGQVNGKPVPRHPLPGPCEFWDFDDTKTKPYLHGFEIARMT